MPNILIAEFGSTTTIVTTFTGIGTASPALAGQSFAPTTPHDVRVGLSNAMAGLEFDHDIIMASSSAAGGLRMTVHGLVYDMTVKAGFEAALGAGANIHMTTAGVLTDSDIERLEKISPGLILLAGGTDYGEKETALQNARLLAAHTTAPVIYCGNVQNQMQIQNIFSNKKLYITENVYPRLDDLNVVPVRKIIQQAFEEHITKAPGMEHVREMVEGSIMPTPGAVMAAAEFFYEEFGDVVVVDVGGATTDVHSVTDGSTEIAPKLINPEPKAKRTVEGDLGVYVNAQNLAQRIGIDADFTDYPPIPTTPAHIELAENLAYHASEIALRRHTGTLRHTYTAAGRRTWAEGKDLTKVKHLLATGGALTKLPAHMNILQRLTAINKDGSMLYPTEMNICVDKHYIMAAVGVLGQQYPDCAKKILAQCMG